MLDGFYDDNDVDVESWPLYVLVHSMPDIEKPKKQQQNINLCLLVYSVIWLKIKLFD